MKIKSTKETLDKILELLKINQNFCYTRFGDSQLMVMNGWLGQDWEQTSSPMLKELQIKAFEMDDPRYLIAPSCGYELEPGMRNGTFGLYRNDKELCETAEKHAKTSEFWHCEALHYGMLFNHEITKEIFKEINKHKILIICGEDLAPVKEYFPKADIITIPMANAFRGWEDILTKIDDYAPEIVLLSCGLTSQVIQYFMFTDKPYITTINMGSVFNALLEINEGIHSRAWIRDNIEEIHQFKKLLNA